MAMCNVPYQKVGGLSPPTLKSRGEAAPLAPPSPTPYVISLFLHPCAMLGDFAT